MVLTRSQRRELESSSSSSGGNDGSNDSGSDSSVVPTTKQKAAGGATGATASPAKFGRGCRERRQTHFFEEEVATAAALRVPRRRNTNGNSDDDLDHHDEEQQPRRFPMRDAARRAVEKVHSMLLDEEEEDATPLPPLRRNVPTSNSSRGGRGGHGAATDAYHNKKRARSDSLASSAIATPSESEREDGGSSDTSDSVINEEDARKAVKSAKDQKTPLSRVVSDLVSKASPKYRNASAPQSGVAANRPPTRPSMKDHDPAAPSSSSNANKEKDEDLGDITPLPIDPSISFANVGGLPQHIVALREMIMIPLLYPKVLASLGATPPKGVLFVGPPGTGKTLLARAVANECQMASNRKVTFYMRKGADILSKWVGESEKQLRLLFDEARKHQPSIIFFDEIDGLAPVRHSKQEQTHAALVSTLLAMMDGLDDRGQVIIIGATNRPDTIDPALRRPGRFDRELRFPVPDEAARRHIINIHTNKMSIGGRTDERDRVTGALLKASEGWTGADIQACCTEATLHALRTKLPQIFVSNKRLKIPSSDLVIHVSEGDVHAASMKLAPSLRRAAASAAANAGGAYVPSILEHMDLLVRTPVLRLAESIEKTFHPAMELARQSSRTTDTSDLLAAIRTMNAAPLPHIPRGALSIVVDDNPNRSTFGATEVVKGLAKHYSSLPAVHISLPLLLRGTVSVQLTDPKKGPAAYDGGGDDDVASRRSYATEHASTPSDLFSSLRNLAPCVAYFHEADAWLEAHSDVPLGGESKAARPHDANEEEEEHMDEHLSIWRSELLATLQSADVLVVLPLARDRVVQLEASLIGIPLLARLQSSLLMCDVVHTDATPQHADHSRWVSYLWSCAEAVQYAVAQKTTSLAEYPEDDSPPPPLSPRTRHAEHAQQKVLWQRVEYKRRQLRHLLAQWLSQFIAGRRFQILLSADLDLTEDSPQWADWQRHVRGRRVGLQDIMEKLENEEYNCLSQYVGDVEQLCSNVRTFFVTRSLADQRYRHRAMELKETTVLNMYKIHKNVTSFCEENKDMNEPISSDDDDEEEESTEIANQKAVAGSGSHDTVKALPTSTVVPKKKKKKNTGTFGRSRRKKKKSVKKAPPPKSASPNTTKDHHESDDEETTDEEEGHDASSVSPQNAGNKECATVIDDTPDASPLGKVKVRASTDGGEEKEAPHASPQVRPAATTSSAGGSPQSNASSSVYGNIGSLSSSRDSSSGDQMDNSAATALSSQAAPPRQLFPVVVSTGSDVKRLPPNPEALSGEQLRQWSSLASRSLTLEELHLVTFHVLRALDAWRWEGNTAAASTTSTSQRWEVRFASIWEIAVRAASPP